MAFRPTYQELLKYWALILTVVIALGAGAGKIGQARLTSAPAMMIMDQQTKTQIVQVEPQDMVSDVSQIIVFVCRQMSDR